MEKIEITNLTAFVHLDWSALNGECQPDAQNELRRRWDQRVEDIASNPTRALLYFSTYGEELDENYRYFYGDVFDLNQERIKRYRERLGDRLIVFPYSDDDIIKLGPVIADAQRQRFTYDPRRLVLESCGEWLEWCVTAWGIATADSLRLNSDNCFVIPSLSVSIDSQRPYKYLDYPGRIRNVIDLVNVL